MSAQLITRDTTPLTPGERLGNWYVQIVRLDEYRLITGPKRDLAYEYARTEMLDAAPSDERPWQSYSDLSHGF